MKNLVALIFIFSFILLISCGNENNPSDENDNETSDETGEITDEISDDDVEYKCLHHCWISPYQGSSMSRFTESGNGMEIVLHDPLTGLEWTRTIGMKNLKDAIEQCDNLTYDGKTDWRLPDIDEFESIVFYGLNDHPSKDVIYSSVTSTISKDNPDNVWTGTITGITSVNGSVSQKQSFICVRGTENIYSDELNRFEKIKDGDAIIIYDRKTGLEWTQDLGLQNDLSYCGNLNYGTAKGWQMPDIYQLRTLVNRHVSAPASDFPKINNGFYLSSTEAECYGDCEQNYLGINFEIGNVARDYPSEFNLICFRHSAKPFKETWLKSDPADPELNTCKEKEYWNGTECKKTCVDKECGWDKAFCGTCDIENGYYCDINNNKCVKWRPESRLMWDSPYKERDLIENRFTESGNGEEIIVSDKYTSLQWTKATWPGTYPVCQKEYAGLSDWREPHIWEIESLVKYYSLDQETDQLDKNSDFPGIPEVFFISNTNEYRYPGYSKWGVDLSNSSVITADYEYDSFYICVRGKEESTHTDNWRFTRLMFEGESSIYDHRTEKQWAGTTLPGSDYEQAVKYCEELEYAGFDDWKLPDTYEMRTLIDWVRFNPASMFPIIRSEKYWTSNRDKGRIIDFEDGTIAGVEDSNTYALSICVRN